VLGSKLGMEFCDRDRFPFGLTVSKADKGFYSIAWCAISLKSASSPGEAETDWSNTIEMLLRKGVRSYRTKV